MKGTDNAQLPFGSPDSRSIGFAASGQLKRIDLEGGDGVRRLANAPVFLGGSWNREGVILFVPSTNAGVFRISADNPGKPIPVTPAMPDGQASAPCFIPGTDRFLFYVSGSQAQAKLGGVYLSNAKGSEVRRLFDADTSAVYAPSGHILFGLKEALLARPFDAAQLQVTGDTLQLADKIMVRRFAGVRLPLSRSPIPVNRVSHRNSRTRSGFSSTGSIGSKTTTMTRRSPTIRPWSS